MLRAPSGELALDADLALEDAIDALGDGLPGAVNTRRVDQVLVGMGRHFTQELGSRRWRDWSMFFSQPPAMV